MGWNRLLASPRFRRLSTAFPLTRPIARRRSGEVFDLCAGFVYTQTVLVCLDLGILDLLVDRAATPAEMGRALGVREDRMKGLLDAAESIHLVRRLGGQRYVLGRYGAPLVDNEELRSVFRHGRILYKDLVDPMAILKGGGLPTRLSRYWPYAESDAPEQLSGDDVEPYSRFMAASQPLIAEEVLSHDPFAGVTRVLDVGGGEGVFLEAVGRAYPELSMDLLDLPAVAARARSRFAGLGWQARARAHGGDFLRDPLPGRPDAVSLVRVVHDLDDDDARTLLARVRVHLPEGGRLVIAEPMSGMRGAKRVGAAYFFWYLSALGHGRPRTPEELTALLLEAGFSRVSKPVSRNPVIAAVIRATV